MSRKKNSDRYRYKDSDRLDRLTLVLLHADKIGLLRIARAEGETLSVLIRRLIRQELQRYKEKENENNQIQ